MCAESLLGFWNILRVYFQDDKAKRERDRVKWHALNEEIANLKSQV